MAGPQDDIAYLIQIGDAGTTNVNVTTDVQSFTVKKGRDRETDQYRPATATLTLIDRDRRYDPNNAAGPYQAGLAPLRRIRAQLNSANVENYVLVDPDHYVDGTDTAALDITGNIDVRWFGTLTDWSNGNQSLINKWLSTGNQRSWTMECESGVIRVYISTTGSDFPFTSTFAVPFANGEVGGVRFTRVASTGVTTVYFSDDDGETWDSAGSTVVAAGSNIFSSSANVNLGGQSSGLVNPPTGKVVRAEIYNGVAGTQVAGPNFALLAAGRNLALDPYTDEFGIVWTGRGAGFDTLVYAGSRLFTGYVTDWHVDYHDGDRMSLISIPATDGLGTLASCELDTIAAAHSGDASGTRVQRVLDLAEVAYADPVFIDTGQSTLGATTFGTNALAYLQACQKAEQGYLFVDRNGTLQFLDRHTLLNDSTTEVEFSDAHVGTGILYKRLTQSSSADTLYNRSTAAAVGGTVQTAGDSASQDEYKVRTLAHGTTLLSTDAQALALTQWSVERFKDPEARFASIEINTMSLSDADAQTVALLDLGTMVTVERVPMGGVPHIRLLDLPGTASNYASAPDAADLDIVGNICLVARIAADDWTPAAAQTILSKWTNTGNQRSYRLVLNASGGLTFFWSTTGADNPSAPSTVALASTAGVADGEWLWVAVAFDIDEGGSRVCNLFYSTEDTDDVAEVNWEQLGASVGGAATSIFASTAVVNLSGHTLGTLEPFAGRIAHASIRQGVGTSTTVGGTERLTFNGNVDLENVVPTATSFTATTGETLTLNGTVAISSQAPDTITATCIVDGIQHTITPGSWTTIVNFANADTRPFLTLDHPTLGKIDFTGGSGFGVKRSGNRLAF